MSRHEPLERVRGRLTGAVVVVALGALVVAMYPAQPGRPARRSTPGPRRLPFAVPLARGNMVGDANIASHAHEGESGEVPACSVRGGEVLNICELIEQGPVVLALFVDGGSCTGVLGEMQALQSSFPQVRFAAVEIKGSRSDLRTLIAHEGLTLPGWHRRRRGRCASLYKVLSCPQVDLIYPRSGKVQSRALLNTPSPATLRARVAALVAASAPVAVRERERERAGCSEHRLAGSRGRARAALAEAAAGSEVEVGRAGSLTGASPPDIQQRLRERSSRFRGARAVGIRLEPVPAAYRVFFRHIGLDPDVVRTPIETAVLERMIRGGFPPGACSQTSC